MSVLLLKRIRKYSGRFFQKGTAHLWYEMNEKDCRRNGDAPRDESLSHDAR